MPEPTDQEMRDVLGSSEVPAGARAANPGAVEAPETGDFIPPAQPIGSARVRGDIEEFIELENKARMEFQVVCASWGTPGHHEHSYVKKTLALSQSYAVKLDTRTKGDRMRMMEVPFKVQVRIVSDWEDVIE